MEKGFARVVNQPKSSPTISRPGPIDLQDLQMGLSTYFDDLPDPRVDRTKKHLLKDILVITIHRYDRRCCRVGRHRKLWTQQAAMVRRIFRITQWDTKR